MTIQAYKALPDEIKPLADEIMRLSVDVSKLLDFFREMDEPQVRSEVRGVIEAPEPKEPNCPRHPTEPVQYTCKACVDDLLGKR